MSEMSERMREFQSEVDNLKVGGGNANPERLWRKLAIVGMVAAVAIELIAYFGSHGTKNALSQRDYIIVALLGVTIGVISTGIFVVTSLTRYLRYWLIRLIYQERESTDRVVDAVKR